MTWIWLIWVLCLFFFLAGYPFGCVIGWNKAIETIDEIQQEKNND